MKTRESLNMKIRVDRRDRSRDLGDFFWVLSARSSCNSNCEKLGKLSPTGAPPSRRKESDSGLEEDVGASEP